MPVTGSRPRSGSPAWRATEDRRLTTRQAERIRAAARPMPLHPRVATATLDGRHYVVKRPRRTGRDAADGGRELRATRFAATLPGAANAPLTAAPVWADAAGMIFETRPDYRSLHDVLAERWDATHAVACGRTLGRLHAAPPPPGLPAAGAERPRLLPLTLEEYATTADCVVRMLGSLDAVDGLMDTLRAADEASGSEPVVVHGDFKPDNVLLAPPPAAELRVIDWELSGLGDPHDDVAAFLAGLLSLALTVRRRAAVAEDRAAQREAIAAAADDAFAGTSLLLDGYREHRDWRPEPRVLVLRTAARMLCRAQALAAVNGQLGPVPTILGRAVAGMLRDVDATAERLVDALRPSRPALARRAESEAGDG